MFGLYYGHKMFSSDGSNDIGWSLVFIGGLFASSWPLKMCATLWALVTLAHSLSHVALEPKVSYWPMISS